MILLYKNSRTCTFLKAPADPFINNDESSMNYFISFWYLQ